MTLAQMGAEVIRIDLPGGGLDYRRSPVTEEQALGVHRLFDGRRQGTRHGHHHRAG
jgi:crotonobetainyl-CoA:carnitine CoA-transferase CaiB-like acyl-CoA transferase